MNIGPDKILHALVSYVLAEWNVAAAVVLGFLKEGLDLLGLGVADAGDIVANFVGIFFSIAA